MHELPSEFDISQDKDWLNPVEVLKLQRAVHNRQPQVVLANKTFDISYHDDRVFVKQADVFAGACGWFTYKKLASYDFEQTDHDTNL